MPSKHAVHSQSNGDRSRTNARSRSKHVLAWVVTAALVVCAFWALGPAGALGSGPGQPGRYAGANSGGFSGPFYYVSADGTKVQDVTTSRMYLNCTPADGNIDGDYFTNFSIPQVAIQAGGSFSGTNTVKDVVEGVQATFTYRFGGQLNGNHASGTMREDLTFTKSGITRNCTSGPMTWSASRILNGDPSTPPQPGSYGGTNSGGFSGPSFYLSADATKMQDVTTSRMYLNCAPTNGSVDGYYWTNFSIPQLAIQADGSFSGTNTVKGVVGGVQATFTYRFTGHFHGSNNSGGAIAAGRMREDLSFTKSGVTHKCTSGSMTWSASRIVSGDPTAPPQPGSYTGTNSAGFPGPSFQVSPNAQQLQDVTTSRMYLYCAPADGNIDGYYWTNFSIPQLAIQADGSFSRSKSVNGSVEGVPATFTFTFSGHFHGTNGAGRGIAAGTMREDLSFTKSGVSRSCTSGPLTWSATRKSG